MPFAPWSVDAANVVLSSTSNEPGPVLISLQALQDHFGYVHEDALELVAKACNVSKAEVHGVLTFYHDLRTQLPAKTIVQVCVAEACQAMGSRVLLSEAQAGLAQGRGDVEIEHVYCLGNCALGPTAAVNGKIIGRASAAKLKEASR